MSTRRLIVHAAQLREELDRLPIDALVALELPSADTKAHVASGGLLSITAELRTPSLLVLRPYAMAGPDMALFDAIQRNDASACLAAIEAGADVDAREARSPVFDYATPLLEAAGSPELVRLLLARGADPNARSGSNWTALMRACNAGCLESARQLLDAGADPSVLNNEGYSAYGRTPGNNLELLALLQAATDRTV
jgi:hypothetical protein